MPEAAMTPPPQRVAVVGSGVAGLTAAYVASRTAHVTLLEADDRLGGHADTHVVRDGDRELALDTGFIVHNPRTYPVLLRLFAELGVVTQPSEMSMSVRDDGTGLQWAGALGLNGVFPTVATLTNPRYLRMLTEVPRFHRRARRSLAEAGPDITLGEFLARGRFTAYFHRHFMEPLVAAVWSCDPAVALDYPARYLFTFLEHHGMLGVFGSPQWRTVTGGSQQYVAAVAARLPEVRTGVKVTSVLETPDGVEVTDGNGAVRLFDAAVIATHPGQALAMLAEPTLAQRDVLSAMPYSRSAALLHTDTSVLPSSANARASWNFGRLARGTEASRRSRGDVLDHRSDDQVLVTYDLTRLQRLDTNTRYLVTLVQDGAGEELVDQDRVVDRMEYEHPLYNPASVAAQALLPTTAGASTRTAPARG
jgi:predicted NAD/FAD-binding protein